MPADCLFCRIAAGDVPATIVARDRGMLAFADIAPKAPVHVLVIPERHVDSMAGVEGLTTAERADMLARRQFLAAHDAKQHP